MRFPGLVKQYMGIISSRKVVYFLFLIYLIFAVMILVLRASHFARILNKALSIADGFSMFSYCQMYPLLIIPVTSIVLITLFQYDFNIFIIVRQKARKVMWFKQVAVVLMASFIINILLIIIIGVITSMLTQTAINWDSNTSLFYKMNNNKTLTENPSIAVVILSTFLTSFFSVSIMSMLMIFAKWIDKTIHGFIFMLAICSIDTFYPSFFALNSTYFPNWSKYESIFTVLILPALIMVAIIFLGVLAVPRKEFLNANEK